MGPDSSLTPDLIQAQTFTSAFRGYDQSEVRAFLSRVASGLRAWQERAEELESAWQSAEERAARPPVLDEETLVSAVGEETASILRSARAAASDLRAKAQDESERTVALAQEEAERLTAEAAEALERATSAAEEAASRLLASAREEAAELLEKARGDAGEIRSHAEKDGQVTIDAANSTRDRILDDLARRRRIATVQIEQLRAGRERLIESYAVVRRTFEEAQAELSRADAEARAAADEVGRRLRGEKEPAAADSESTAAAAAAAAPALVAPGGESPPESEQTGPDATGRHAPSPDNSGAGDGAGDGATVETDVPESAGEPDVSGPGAGEPARATDQLSAAAGEEGDGLTHHGEADPGSDGDGEGEDASVPPRSAVEELFARIRANRPDEQGADEASPSDLPDGQPDHDPSGATAASSREPDTADGDEEDEPRVSDGDERLLQERESAMLDLETTLTRRLKRALQDEQNGVLDRLRNLKEEAGAELLLDDEAVQVARYSDAARPLLVRATAAGAAFALKNLHGAERAAGSPEVDDLAREAGAGIVEGLRRRIEQAVRLCAGDEQAVLVESIGAAYREWKTQRIERLAGDVLSAAFSRGTWHAVPDGAVLRWIVEDADGPCPDCDDDALAGELPKGETFPTGQHHPPAHSGCRCLLVPSKVAS